MTIGENPTSSLQQYEEVWLEYGPPADVVLPTIASALAIPALLLDADLRVRCGNAAAFSASRPWYEWEDGRRYADPMPAHVAGEREPKIRQALRSGRRLIMDGMLWGVLTRTQYAPFDRDGEPMMFVLFWPLAWGADDEPSGDADYQRASAHDLGPLEQLTEREIEVLTLVGRGLSNDAIARELHRSVKTVQGHRLSLGSKLGISNRVQVAATAADAGLDRHSLETVRLIWKQSREHARK